MAVAFHAPLYGAVAGLKLAPSAVSDNCVWLAGSSPASRPNPGDVPRSLYALPRILNVIDWSLLVARARAWTVAATRAHPYFLRSRSRGTFGW
jgi:hypothetical protein